MYEQLLLLSLGWLGGVLSPALVETIKRRREMNSVIPAMKDEMNEVAYRLALAGYNAAIHLGTVDRSLLLWVKDAMSLYYGKEPKQRIADYIEVQLGWTEEKLLANTRAEAAKEGAALVVPKFATPFADTRVPSWHLLPAVVRLDLLAMQADICLLNDAADMSRKYMDMTFTVSTNEDHHAVTGNLRGSYIEYGRCCRRAAARLQQLQMAL